MYFELKENRPHGTPENPFSQYHISDVKRAFQIPVHWHDELEIIYVKQGKLHVTISGENYIGSPISGQSAFNGLADRRCRLLHVSVSS